MSDYQLPRVWKTPETMTGLNRPTAGSRFQQTLPRGEAIYQLYSLGTPNGIKVTIMFEELRELGINIHYDLFKIDISEGNQFGSDFVAINPNSKIPALLDLSDGKEIRVFESANILLYLADKHHAFLPETLSEKTEVLNWLFWQTGAAPFLGGGFGHFFHYAPEKIPYAIDRYTMEAKRQLDVLDKELAHKTYISGDQYTIADIAIWSWYGRLVEGKLYEGSDVFLDVNAYTHLGRWTRTIADRPAVKRALDKTYQPLSDTADR
ncbi:glutathione-dependent disulfide-bond oxidoreductase [Streptococcus pluranimalium]|uniref:glutathione-dependent disulfide-bond oxidoreductase n=1 Tax=Streptococcus hyovaginalis TaxID=149015 RepID=UPI003AC39B13